MEVSDVIDFHSPSTHQTESTVDQTNGSPKPPLPSFSSLLTDSEFRWDNFTDDPYLDTYLDIANNFLTINDHLNDVDDEDWPESIVNSLLSETNNVLSFEDQQNQLCRNDELFQSILASPSPSTSSSPSSSSSSSSLPLIATSTMTRPKNFPNLTLRELVASSTSSTPSTYTPSPYQCTQSIVKKKEEPWRASVAQRILSAYYTPLSLKSEYLGSQIALDEFQSLAIKETVQAFLSIDNEPEQLTDQSEISRACSAKVISALEGIRAYRRLPKNEKASLLATAFFDIATMKGMQSYDANIQGWKCSVRSYKLADLATVDPKLKSDAMHIIETFPVRWKEDFTVTILLYLIMIFNPDLPRLAFPDTIRKEQYNFIYLLRRYLESACGSPCEAQDDLYKLLVKVEQVQELRVNMIRFFETMYPGSCGPLKHEILALIQG